MQNHKLHHYFIAIPGLLFLILSAYFLGLQARDGIEQAVDTQVETGDFDQDDVVIDEVKDAEENILKDYEAVLGREVEVDWYSPDLRKISTLPDEDFWKTSILGEGDWLDDYTGYKLGFVKTLGTITDGLHEGSELIKFYVISEGMGTSYYSAFGAKTGENSYVMFLNNSGYGGWRSDDAYDINAQWRLESFPDSDLIEVDTVSFLLDRAPEALTLENGTRISYTGRYVSGVDLRTFDNDYLSSGPTDSEVAVYDLQGGGSVELVLGDNTGHRDYFFYLMPDGSLARYVIDLTGVFGDFDLESGESFEVTNSSSGEIVNYHIASFGGCGVQNSYSVERDPEILETLQPSSIFSANGRQLVLYIPDYSLDKFQQMRNWYDLSFVGEGLDAFEDGYLVVYYKDTLGRYVKLTRSEAVSLAECGKPVIYLYPEESTDLLVQVEPVGGFTKVEPAYNDGWRVTAYPDGRLINLDDGQEYPYLFWEGRGGEYEFPNNYFVVAQEDLDEFLPNTLWRLGLNEQEIADFLEFWRPLMEDRAYYKIGFYGNYVMSKLAPLKVSKDPDTLIRVLMDFEGLDAPVEANEPNLPKRPERDGFVVTEWGGVLEFGN